jgi:hypothetical protein
MIGPIQNCHPIMALASLEFVARKESLLHRETGLSRLSRKHILAPLVLRAHHVNGVALGGIILNARRALRSAIHNAGVEK